MFVIAANHNRWTALIYQVVRFVVIEIDAQGEGLSR